MTKNSPPTSLEKLLPSSSFFLSIVVAAAMLSYSVQAGNWVNMKRIEGSKLEKISALSNRFSRLLSSEGKTFSTRVTVDG